MTGSNLLLLIFSLLVVTYVTRRYLYKPTEPDITVYVSLDEFYQDVRFKQDECIIPMLLDNFVLFRFGVIDTNRRQFRPIYEFTIQGTTCYLKSVDKCRNLQIVYMQAATSESFKTQFNDIIRDVQSIGELRIHFVS